MKRTLGGKLWRLAVFPIMLLWCLIGGDTLLMIKYVWRDIWREDVK